MDQNLKDILAIISQIITVIAAIGIPLLIYRLSTMQTRRRDELAKMQTKIRDELAKTNETLKELSEFNQYYVGEVLAKIHRVAKKADLTQNKDLKELTYAEISQELDLKLAVEQILNQVDYLCIGIYKGVFREDLVTKVLNGTIKYIWFTFQNFVEARRRKLEDKNIWIAIENYIAKNNE